MTKVERDFTKDLIKETIQETISALKLDPEEHYKDHLLLSECRNVHDEMKSNHEFVTSVRQAGEAVKKASIWTTVTLLLTAFFGFVVYHLRNP